MNEKSFSKKKLIKEYLKFNWKSYIDAYDDLNYIITKEDAWYHWINYGKYEGRLLYSEINDKNFEKFNWKSYIHNNEDLSYIKTKEEAWKHWIKYGKNENRIIDFPNNKEEYINFNWEIYVNNYEDLSYIKTKEEAWKHWINYGKDENRIIDFPKEYINFNWEIYVNNYEDLSSIKSKEEAWKHWINYGKDENRIIENIFLLNDYETFDWKKYVNNYDDLTYIDSKEEAWRHFIHYGFNEGRKLNDIKEIELNELKKIEEHEYAIEEIDFSTNKIYFKNKYTNCGKHFFGWKSSMNYLLENYKFENLNFNKKYYFDEWIEKLLVWGNKLQSEKILKTINEKNLQLISFLHCPPCEKCDIENIKSEILLNDETLLNKNIINLIENNNLLHNITFLYVLSIYHKNYIVNTYPQLKNNILSLYHPIDIHNCEKEDLFNIRKFMNEKNIYHIGWWLRNFTTFINFNAPKGYHKLILLKQEFAHQFNEQFTNIDKNIQIINELNDDEYKKIFNSSCIFCDLVDAIANNVVLECIKYNTPIIVRRIPSVEEYLGSEYPLFFDNIDDLDKLRESKFFYKKIIEANNYLKNMNKNPFMLETFLDKVNYDINKLNINDNKYKLTWLYYLNNNDDDIEKYISIFRQQLNIEKIKLVIINSLEEKIELLEEYNCDNITIIHVDSQLPINEIYDIFIKKSTTEYLTFKNFNIISTEENYSDLCINYLDNNPTFDVVIFKNNSVTNQKKLYENDINNDDKLEIQHAETTDESNDSVANIISHNDINNNNDYYDNTEHDDGVSYGVNFNHDIDTCEDSEVSYFIQNNDDGNQDKRTETNEIIDILTETSDEITDETSDESSSIFTDISDNYTSLSEKTFNLDENDDNKIQEINNISHSNIIENICEKYELDNIDENININNNLLTFSQVRDYNFCDTNINILWRKSIHEYIHNFDENFFLECHKNHLNIFEIQYNNLGVE
jgi:hypothetical protein